LAPIVVPKHRLELDEMSRDAICRLDLKTSIFCHPDLNGRSVPSLTARNEQSRAETGSPDILNRSVALLKAVNRILGSRQLPERSNRTFHLLSLRLPRQLVANVAPVSDR
jgi:hypothetical protein